MPWVLLVCGVFLLVDTASGDNEFATIIQNARVQLQDDVYVLQAQLDFPLSPASRDALDNGIALTWTIPVSVQQQRSLWWNKEIFSLNLHYQIRYYALLNIYRVKSEHNNQVNNFASLSTALKSMASLTVPLLNKTLLNPDSNYTATFRVAFDHNTLPIPLRPLTYFDQQWYLSSEWATCSLPK